MQLLLQIQLLGSFSFFYGGKPVESINTVRVQSLLAFLVLNADIPQSRQHLAFLLWPDTSESNARNNLRQFLYQLRRLLPDPGRFLRTDANTVCWRQDEGQIIDVKRFERAVAQAEAAEQRRDTTATQDNLKEALSYYQGDLLPDCYDDWINSPRQRLKQLCRYANQRLVRVLEGGRDFAGALHAGESLLRLDPLDENAYVTLMRLHELNQDRPAARRLYQTAVETLRRELDVEPGKALRQAYDRVKRLSETRNDEPTTLPLAMVGRQIEWQQLQTA